MSAYNAQTGYRQHQHTGSYGSRGGGGGRRNNDRQYRGHGPTSQVGQPPIIQQFPRPTPPIQNRVLLPQAGTPQILMSHPGLANPRAPTVFSQNYGVVPPPLTQQLITQTAPPANLQPHQIYYPHQQTSAFATTQQPINLGLAGTPQIAAATAPQQISAGIHTMPPVLGATGTTSQVPPSSTQTFRPRAQTTGSKQRSKAIKIIDPNTNREVNVGESKQETPQPLFPDIPPPVTTAAHATPSIVPVAPAHSFGTTGGNLAQDFKRRVHERNTAPPPNVQEAVFPPASKRPVPNAIITDPNSKVGQFQSKLGSESNSSKQPPAAMATVDVEPINQEPQKSSVVLPASAAHPTVSEATQQGIRDEFLKKVRQSVHTPPPIRDEKKTTEESSEGDEQRESVAGQSVTSKEEEPPAQPLISTAPPSADVPPPAQVEVKETESKSVIEKKGEEKEVKKIEEEEAESAPANIPVPAVSESSAKTNEPPSVAEATTSDMMQAEVTVDHLSSDHDDSVKQPEAVTPVVPITEEPSSSAVTAPSSSSMAAAEQEEIFETVEAKDTDSEARDSDVAKSQQSEEVSSSSGELTATVVRREEEERKTAEPGLPSQVVPEAESAVKEEGMVVSKDETKTASKETTEEKSKQTEAKEEEVERQDTASDAATVAEVDSGLSVKPCDVEEVPVVSGKDTASTAEPQEIIESETVQELSLQTTGVERQEEPSLPSEIKMTDKPPEPVKPVEKVLAQDVVQPAEKGRISPLLPPSAVPATTRPREPVKPAEPVKSEKKFVKPADPVKSEKEPVKPAELVKPEKKGKPLYAKPTGFPASARPAPPTEPPASTQPQEERTQYAREFLLKFKEMCTEFPPEWMKLDVLKELQPTGRAEARERGEYSRDYSRESSRDYSMSGRKGGRRQGDNRRSNYQQASKEPVDLHKAEHRWVRPSRVAGDLTEEEKETEELFRKFQGILNKLTPQKFQNLAEQALKLKIDSEQRLKGCIDKIFTKALEEPKFSIAYANLCKVMSTIKVETMPEDGKGKVVTFRRVLLTKCQQEFEKDKKEDEERETMLSAIKETEDADKRKQLEDDLAIWETKHRKRSLGNIRFIGELFKLKMLSETIMHECVVRLLRSSSDEESLECFAGLITTTGKDLDKPEAKVRINQYFTRIAEIIKKGKVPARIKFMLQDVQDLRTNDWVPRQRQEQSLKTIDQIHQEAKVEEEKEKQFVAQAIAGSMKHGGGGGRDGRRGSLKPDDWQGGKGDRDRRDKDRDRDREKPKEKLDARRLQVLLKQREKSKDAGAPMLGPATFRPQGWGRGGSGAASSLQDSAKTDKDKRPARTSSSSTKRSSDKDKLPVGRGSGSGPKRGHSTPTPDSQSEKALAIQAVQQATTKLTQQQQGQSKGQTAGGTRGEQKPVSDKMDEATVRRKTTTIVDELVQNKDFKEAIECVREMKSPGKMNFLISEAINHSLEKSTQHRQMSGRLFSKLLEGRYLTEAKFMEGLNEVLEFAEDMAIDIPKIWDYLGEILSPVVSHSILPLSFLSSVYPSLLASGKAGILAAKVLVQCRSQLASDAEVTSLWTASSLEWSSLGVPSEELGEFLSTHNLTYLQGSSQPSSDSQPLNYLEDLTSQFSASDVTNDDVFNWIETNCPPQVRSTPEFVTTVTTAIVNATVSGSGSNAHFREEDFSKRAVSINKYVVENKELQLRVLYALQISVAKLKHPPGMLNSMFNVIYDLEIVGEDIFRKWKDEGTESFGKGGAVATVKNFFDWLDSCETESDDGT